MKNFLKLKIISAAFNPIFLPFQFSSFFSSFSSFCEVCRTPPAEDNTLTGRLCLRERVSSLAVRYLSLPNNEWGLRAVYTRALGLDF
ncbi:hypothetical protein E2C01_046377 [Portunus trituberculatus]|uniref:Uncharacterized protein n=1 Tax=Portunus trituberculatus TaxID=210409 RepID=A0A5B7G4M0_PORTR|nr:hypothetical protein [Portunus trituberculatus]